MSGLIPAWLVQAISYADRRFIPWGEIHFAGLMVDAFISEELDKESQAADAQENLSEDDSDEQQQELDAIAQSMTEPAKDEAMDTKLADPQDAEKKSRTSEEEKEIGRLSVMDLYYTGSDTRPK